MDIQKAVETLKNTKINNSQILSVTYEIGRVEVGGDVFSDLPPFYRIVIKSAPSPRSLIYTEVWLPEKWNGIFIATGNGGMAGKIVRGGFDIRIKQGYAIANTDMGTSGGRSRGIDNPDVWKDFGHRATYIMTKASKALIFALYNKKPDYSYFIGASTGGQQALAAAQRFGEEFDGIIAAVPANNRTHLHTYFLWNHVHLRTKDGKCLFTDEEVCKVTDAATKYFQLHKDGNKGDNFITYPYLGENTVEDFIKYLDKKNMFSPKQIDALKAIYTGPVNPRTGERIYNGMPIGSEIYGCGIIDSQKKESPHYYPFIWAFGKDYDCYSFDFDKDMEEIDRKEADDMNANSVDLSSFFSHGGRLLMYSGSCDACVPYPDALGYYMRLKERFGSYERLSESMRYFIVPGRDHGCSGRGSNALFADEDMIEDEFLALRKWCQKGIAPKYLVAARIENGQTVFTRKIYPCGSENNRIKNIPPCCDKIYTAK